MSRLVTLLVLLASAAALDWSDLEALGVVCPLQHSCRQEAPPTGCRCDELCALHGDCCLDAPAARPSTATCIPIHPQVRIKPQTLGAQTVGSCPPGTDPSGACSRPDWSDPWLQAPLTDAEGVTFANAYCALCHGADPERLERWQLLLSCPSLGHSEVDASDVFGGLRRRSDGKWAVEWAGQDHVCTPVVGGPPEGTPLRSCHPDAVGACPPEWSRPSPCAEYTAPVFGAGGAVYRNPHCAVCHGAALQALACQSRQSVSAKRGFDFSRLFVVPESEGGCGRGRRLDPFSRTCRNLRCKLPGYVVKGKRCVKA